MIRRLSLVLAILILASTPMGERPDSQVSASSKIIVRDRFTGVPVPSVTLDRFGGRTDIQCPAGKGWTTAKINNRWWICTPAGHGIFMQGMFTIPPGASARKYGGNDQWSVATLDRLTDWNFNTLNWYVTAYVWPTAPVPIKLPFWENVRPGLYAMRNSLVDTQNNGSIRLLPEPIKDLIYIHSPVYTGWMFDGVPDFYDAKLYTWLKQDLAQEALWKRMGHSPYLMGLGADDSDQMAGFKNGGAFQSFPSGHNSFHLAWFAATCSPVQTANGGGFGAGAPTLYMDTTVYTKKMWRDYLVGKYGTIAALNAAWGSNYTTFDSSGTTVTGESMGTGDGSTTTFSHTLAKTPVSQYSAQILVNEKRAAGDTRDGKLAGPTVSSGTISYAKGQVSIAFKSAPSRGASITISYQANAWLYGSGVLDEDGRASHTWIGQDFIFLSTTNPTVKADFDA